MKLYEEDSPRGFYLVFAGMGGSLGGWNDLIGYWKNFGEADCHGVISEGYEWVHVVKSGTMKIVFELHSCR